MVRLFFLGVIGGFSILGVAQTNMVGVYKPDMAHGKLSSSEMRRVRQVEAAMVGSSMKLNKDRTFGLSFGGRILLGKYSIRGTQLVLTVNEIVGKTKADVAKLPARERIARFQIAQSGKKLLALPAPSKQGAPRLVWTREAN